MPRANRHYLPGHIWHITHRWHHWVFEAKKRLGLSVLDYIVTSNHVHLLVKDTGQDVMLRACS